MIAVDSCVVIDYLAGVRSAVTEITDEALSQGRLALPTIVITELYSDPEARNDVAAFVQTALLLEFKDDFWVRAGLLRAKIRKLGLKANLGDALIAQSCIDHDVPLLTVDADFRHYVKVGELKLAK